MRFRAPEKLTLCFYAANELEDLTWQTKPATSTFWIKLIPQILPTLSISSGNLASRLRTSLTSIKIFSDLSSNEVTVQLGTSYLSQDMAHSYLPQPFLRGSKKEAADQWNQLLKRIVKRCRRAWPSLFDHCLYRLSLFLKPFMKQIALRMTGTWMSPSENQTRESLYQYQFWDLFRTSFPLFSLVYPDYYQVAFSEGFLNLTRILVSAKWLAPGERGMMPGTLIDGVFADAVTKGSHQTCMKTCWQLCSRRLKKQIPLNILSPWQWKATRPLATSRWFSRKCEP